MYDVVAIGELLIDFTPHGKSDIGHDMYEVNPGGAPANVLAILARLGKRTGFIGKVGQDEFGALLEKTLKSTGIDSSGVVASPNVPTTLAFVHLTSQGERTFTFYRHPGADQMLEISELDDRLVLNTRIFHFGSVSLTHDPSRSATLEAVRRAKEHGALISYDPNLRQPLWGNLQDAKNIILSGLQHTDVLKVSEEELEFLTGESNLEAGSHYLWDHYQIPLIFVTLGERGCFFRFREAVGEVASFDVQAIDTTGAGDAFFGAVLYQLSEREDHLANVSVTEIEAFVRFGNAAGAWVTTKKGALSVMPTKAEIEVLLNNDEHP